MGQPGPRFGWQPLPGRDPMGCEPWPASGTEAGH